MTANPSSWYVSGKGQQPAGPFSAEQIIDSWQSGRLAPDTLCWRDGMPQWLPLTTVEPFASVRGPGAASTQASVDSAAYQSSASWRPAPRAPAAWRPRGPKALLVAASVGGGVALLVVGVVALLIHLGKGESQPGKAPSRPGETLSDAAVLSKARQEIESRLLRSGDSWYGYRMFQPISFGERVRPRPAELIEMKEFSVVAAEPVALSPADMANRVQWQGRITFQCRIYRTMEVTDDRGTLKLSGRWGPWRDVGGGDPGPFRKRGRGFGGGGPPLFASDLLFGSGGTLPLTIRNGRWEWCVTDAEKPAFDCESIPK